MAILVNQFDEFTVCSETENTSYSIGIPIDCTSFEDKEQYDKGNLVFLSMNPIAGKFTKRALSNILADGGEIVVTELQNTDRYLPGYKYMAFKFIERYKDCKSGSYYKTVKFSNGKSHTFNDGYCKECNFFMNCVLLAFEGRYKTIDDVLFGISRTDKDKLEHYCLSDKVILLKDDEYDGDTIKDGFKEVFEKERKK